MGVFDIFNFSKARKAKEYDGMTAIDMPFVEQEYIDMENLSKRKRALNLVAPLSYVLSRIGSMASDGVPYVVDSKNNEVISDEYEHIRKVLDNPNPMQDFSQFLKCVQMCVKLYGFCPILLLRATSKSPIMGLVPLQPETFKLENCPNIIQIGSGIGLGKAYVEVDGEKIELSSEEYTIIHDGVYDIEKGKLKFFSPISSLSEHVRNYAAQIKARGSLIINGGGKGIIHGNDTSEFGNLELTPQEKEELNNEFKYKFGLVGQKYQILVTRAKVGWIPLSFDVSQLQLHEEDNACMKDIANALGINPNLFISDSTFQNQEAVKKSAYQDVIIPDANRIARALTNILCSNGIKIKIDYSHVHCLQQDLSASSLSIKNMAMGLKTLREMGMITIEEARIEISKHIDINPNDYAGEQI